MFLLAAILLLGLTRAEIVERFRAAPATQCEGLVQVYADCPADMRKEYQLPVAGFAADVCRKLYRSEKIRPRRFADPGVVIHLGDSVEPVTGVVTRVCRRSDARRFLRVYLPAPGYADRAALVRAVVRGFYLSVKDENLDDAAAEAALRRADPELRVADACRRLDDWRERGIYEPGKDDEDYLKLMRSVLMPGFALPAEVRNFASRLYLYPLTESGPFCGTHSSCDFREAIALARRDPSVRFAAFVKSRQVLIFGAGRGKPLGDAAKAYSLFLEELARLEKDDVELTLLLENADALLKEAQQ